MCTRLVYRAKDDVINGFNFDIDLAVWKHKIIKEPDKFYIGIQMPDEKYHSYHGINRNGNVGTLLYVHGNENARYNSSNESCTIADLVENYICGNLSFDEAVAFVKSKKITYAQDATMQGMLSDKSGRVLIIEPGIGFREEDFPQPYSLMTNYSLLRPESTQAFITPGDDRYERAKIALDNYTDDFGVEDAWSVLKLVHQEGVWATRASFVYSEKEHSVYYVENNEFHRIKRFSFFNR
jgi:hypothetical protein